MRKIGVYAGTFDPVHAGHVAFAGQALRECGLDEVVFLLEREPRGKPNALDLAHRLALLQRAISGEPGLRAAGLRARQFTVRSALPELRSLFGDQELVLLMGVDVLRLLHAWDDVGDLLAVFSLAVALRGSDTMQDVEKLMERLTQMYGPVAYQVVEAKHAKVSSTLVRGGNHDVLHPEVRTYIKQHGLYGMVSS